MFRGDGQKNPNSRSEWSATCCLPPSWLGGGTIVTDAFRVIQSRADRRIAFAEMFGKFQSTHTCGFFRNLERMVFVPSSAGHSPGQIGELRILLLRDRQGGTYRRKRLPEVRGQHFLRI